ncbi:hypothetical protein EDEG_03317 [Edhazardia aedis USNM 41457]|uniref:V-ATPase proteolipid subunit C-like domain-containing protein n=1 Tax=Edhazardia aedis (strain USNM 41457) TaxID=1003232 RepID=J9DLK8_EDHAE|nr:hypothetical protein EDEG_03317 [Edhazardia aedis USNM 41457]|eukprot:EJW02247.1 hypothetical protein EDEG_03317 [Edhazardia aedis USNM 41457]
MKIYVNMLPPSPKQIMYYKSVIIGLIVALIAIKFANILDIDLFLQKISPSVGYLGMAFCFLLSAYGTIKGMKSIGNSVSGGSIIFPRIGSKSVFGTVFCEANFLGGVVICFLMHGVLPSENDSVMLEKSWLIFSACISVGICSYCSSVSTGVICSAICLMDAKDPALFMKLVAMELISSSIGILGLVLGFLLYEKVRTLS